jgi:hypothetical protein
MREIRTRAVAVALLLLGSATGCSGANEPAAAPGPTSTPATTGSAAEATAATPPATTKAAAQPAAQVSRCANADLQTTITLQPDGTAATQRAMVTLTNNGKHACTLDGWLSISPVNAANEVVSVPTRKVDQPGPAEAFTVKPGTSAFAGIKWTVCAESDADCDWSNSLRVSVKGAAADGPFAELEDFPNPERNGIRMKALQIGTLQPSHQAVVAW